MNAIVGPLRRIWFNDSHQPRYYDLPKDTRDLRHDACPAHHPACDCREANIAEAFAEHMAENRQMHDAILAAIKGHNTYPSDAYGRRDEFAQCKCQACILARSIHVGYWQDKADRKAHYERAEAAHWLRVMRDQPQYADEVPF